MPELGFFEYVLVEYSPAPLRETRVAVGLLLFDASRRLVRHKFTGDWRRVRCLDPRADLSLLGGLPGYFESRIADARGFLYEELMSRREEDSGGIQISAPRGVLSTDAELEFETLFREHIAAAPTEHSKRPPRAGSRRWIHAQVSDSLRRHALWERFSKDVAVAEYTAPGDRFRIDFSCRPNGVTHYLHAISLERDWNQAKLLSYTFWRIREQARATMTAIVADPLDAAAAESCRQILAAAEIAIQPLPQLDGYLDAVGRELRQ